MTAELPAPLIAAEVDLQDFPFMPLHVARLRDSDLAAEAHPEACWYAVLLWAASWHQLPAGSLPDTDAVLMRLCGLGRDQRTWKKHRKDALRGFVKCSDGRLYHPVVVEQAVEAWNSKLQQRYRTECARIRKANQRNNTDHPLPTFEEWVEDKAIQVPDVSHGTDKNVPCDEASKRQGQGQGQGIKEEGVGAADAASTEFAWEGRTIRLKPDDLTKWRRSYHAIPDLEAELTSLDSWLEGHPEKQKGWFFTVSGSLNRKHQEILRAAQVEHAGAPLC